LPVLQGRRGSNDFVPTRQLDSRRCSPPTVSLVTFVRYRTGPSGSRLPPQSTPRCVLAALMHFAVLSARSTLDRTTPHRSRGCCSPLSRFTEVLLRRISSVRPLPRARPCSARVLREHPSLVPPSRSLTASMACSARSLAGLLHPASGHEVRRVSRFRHPLDSRPSDHRRVSRDATPLEGFPLSQAVPHPAAAPFLTFARSRVSARLRPDTKASSPHVTECVNRNLRTGRTLTPPLGGWAHCQSSVASCWPSVSRCRASSTTLRAPQVRHGERGKPAPSAFASTTGVVHDRVAPAYLLRRREFPLGGLQDRCATVLVFKVSHRGEVRSVAPCCQ